MITQEFYFRNEMLIRARLESQIEVSLEKGNKYIDKALPGPLNFLIREAVKFFYNGYKKKEMAEGTLDQISVVLNAAKEKIFNPNISYDDLVQKYFPQYLKSDQTAKALRTTHRNYQWCVENTRNIFKAQLESIVPMLKCDEPNINSYLELTAATFKTKEGILKALMKQRPYMEFGLKKIGEDLSILNLPVGREVLFEVLKNSYNETWDDLKKEVMNMNIN
ncbi:MAG: hypothetical protein ACTSRZ_04025 [Promethearchaeota archaeon]